MQNLEQYRPSRLVDGGVSPEQLRQTTLPLAMLSLLIVTFIIVGVGAIMALVLNHKNANRPLLITLLIVAIIIVICLTFAYDAVNQFQ